MPSAPVGGVALSTSALNCRPCVRSVNQMPVAVTHSPAPMRRRVADDRDEVALAARLHLQDGKAVLGIVEGDALDRARQRLQGRSLISLCGSEHLVHGACRKDSQPLRLYRWMALLTRWSFSAPIHSAQDYRYRPCGRPSASSEGAAGGQA